MTVASPPQPTAADLTDEDVPINLRRAPTNADRIFRGVLGASSTVVLLLLAATTLFLIVRGWPALHKAGFSFFTSIYWGPDNGHFGVLPLLVGSWSIAIVGLIVALPVSVAMALMINEYSPVRLRAPLIAFVDALATVPSIVYGLWGYELFSSWQVGPASWLDHHFAFIPILRSPTPASFGLSILATGLVCSLTIIPIITSIVREVMGQVPRDVCEASLGLGGTKWGMITDVVLPFSRNGIVGGALLGFGRGLGETMIPVLLLSTADKLTASFAGPGGLGSIAKEIASAFETAPSIEKSADIMAGLTLFVTTLAVSTIAHGAVRKAGARVR